MIGVAARPTASFLFKHPAHFVALGFGAGLSPVAPGTFGTLVAIPLAALVKAVSGDLGFLLVIALFFALGVWACGVAGRSLGVADHGAIVWDEVVAFMLVLFFIGDDHAQVAYAFIAFRVFDIVKIPPADLIDRDWKSGFGVMADDIVAAFYTLLLLALAMRLFG